MYSGEPTLFPLLTVQAQFSGIMLTQFKALYLLQAQVLNSIVKNWTV